MWKKNAVRLVTVLRNHGNRCTDGEARLLSHRWGGADIMTLTLRECTRESRLSEATVLDIVASDKQRFRLRRGPHDPIVLAKGRGLFHQTGGSGDDRRHGRRRSRSPRGTSRDPFVKTAPKTYWRRSQVEAKDEGAGEFFGVEHEGQVTTPRRSELQVEAEDASERRCRRATGAGGEIAVEVAGGGRIKQEFQADEDPRWRRLVEFAMEAPCEGLADCRELCERLLLEVKAEPEQITMGPTSLPCVVRSQNDVKLTPVQPPAPPPARVVEAYRMETEAGEVKAAPELITTTPMSLPVKLRSEKVVKLIPVQPADPPPSRVLEARRREEEEGCPSA